MALAREKRFLRNTRQVERVTPLRPIEGGLALGMPWTPYGKERGTGTGSQPAARKAERATASQYSRQTMEPTMASGWSDREPALVAPSRQATRRRAGTGSSATATAALASLAKARP